MVASVTVRTAVFKQQAARDAYRSSTEQRARIAHQATDEARAEAPVLTGAYRDGMGVEVSGADVTMVDNDPDAFYKEFGTSDTPAHATMINAASRYGLYSGAKPR